LLFRDEPDGSISVTDAHTQKPVAQFHGEQGFVRGTLRALSRERRRQGLDNAHPFTLSLGTDRRIILRDPSTGEHIDLASFGASNREVFSSLLLDPSHEAFKPSAGAHP
jgi:putative photosynthetic complex assembly protein